MAVAGAAIAVGGSVLSSQISASAAKKAAGAQSDAAENDRRLQQYFYDTSRADLAPYRNTGTAALSTLSDLFLPGGGAAVNLPNDINQLKQQREGLVNQLSGSGASRTGMNGLDGGGRFSRRFDPGGSGAYYIDNEIGQVVPNAVVEGFGGGPDTAGIQGEIDKIDAQINQLSGQLDTAKSGSAPDYSAFFKSPGYNFRLDEGVRAMDRSAAARGQLHGGGYGRSLVEYGQGFASSEFNNYANRLASLAGIGQSATAQTGAFGAQSGALQGQAIQSGGQARASGYVGQANAYNAGIGNSLFALQQYAGSPGNGTSAGFDPRSGINWSTPRIGG